MEAVAAAGEGQDAVLEALDLCLSKCVAKAHEAAVRLKVMDILAEQQGGYQSALQIAARFEAHSVPATAPLDKVASSLNRLLRLLASHGLLSCSPLYTAPLRDGRPTLTYALTTHPTPPSALGNASIDPDSPSWLTLHLRLLECPLLQQTWCHFDDAILNDVVPFVELYGMPLFAYAQRDPEFHDLFTLAMAGHSEYIMTSLIERYGGFRSLCCLVDVGGGNGTCLSMITARYPHINGINFDLPHVVAGAPQYPGIEHVGGDMFRSIPKSQALFLKYILHNWSDDVCLKILERCYEALSGTGKLIVVDALLPDEVESNLEARIGYEVDCLMLAYFEGGKERTKAELEDLAKCAGFERLEVICTMHGCSVVEIYRN